MSGAYSLPVKYNKAARSYVVVRQKKTQRQLGLYEITLEHGDRALPHGYVAAVNDNLFVTYMFAPGRAGSYEHARKVGQSNTKQEAIEDVRKAFERDIP